MPLKFFTIPVRDSEPAEEELNAFLGSYRVLAIDRKLIDLGENSFWALCVDFLPAGSGQAGSTMGKKGRVDYREILPSQEFLVFAKLRELRKQIAQAESVPVYTIFTNEQLAEMVRRRVRNKSDLEGIAGVGDARVSKYGPQFLAALHSAEGDHEASGKPV